MQISVNDKNYRLKKFPPILGRKLMTKGVGVNGILDRDPETWLPILEFVEVGITDEIWIPLSTSAMLDNHVSKAFQPEILTAVLQYNFSAVEHLMSGPTVNDALWAEVYDVFAEVFK